MIHAGFIRTKGWALIGRRDVVQPLIKSWWLLALCGVLDAVFSFLIFSLGQGGSLILRGFVDSRNMIELMGAVALAVGVCTIAAGVWSSRKENSWLLVLNGLAGLTLGLMMTLGASRAVTFRSIALVIAVMAVSIGAFELGNARALRARRADEWLLGVAGVVSVGFALVFLGFVLRWIKLDPSPSAETFNWLGSFFGFSAVCMLLLAFRLNSSRGPGLPISSRAIPLS